MDPLSFFVGGAVVILGNIALHTLKKEQTAPPPEPPPMRAMEKARIRIMVKNLASVLEDPEGCERIENQTRPKTGGMSRETIDFTNRMVITVDDLSGIKLKPTSSHNTRQLAPATDTASYCLGQQKSKLRHVKSSK